MSDNGLDTVYDVTSVADAAELYAKWADGYEGELSRNGYVTPLRCAAALAEHANLPWAPVIELGCGTGLGGMALINAGFECVDGVDISPEMLAYAEAKSIYRSNWQADLSQPLDTIPNETYQNAAAIGVLNPNYIPSTVIDQVLSKLPEGGCFVFSLNDHAIADRSYETRIMELTEYSQADLILKEHGEHLPEIGLMSTIFLLKKR